LGDFIPVNPSKFYPTSTRIFPHPQMEKATKEFIMTPASLGAGGAIVLAGIVFLLRNNNNGNRREAQPLLHG
jgi:hypothetical protein